MMSSMDSPHAFPHSFGMCSFSFISFNQSSSAFLYLSNIQMKHLCQEGLVAGAIIDPPHLPWSVYAYGSNGIALERPIRRNTNVMSYPFPKSTQVVSSLLSLFLSILASNYLF